MEEDTNVTRDAIKGAVDSGAKVVCLTVGSAYQPVLGRDVHNRYLKPSRPRREKRAPTRAAGLAASSQPAEPSVESETDLDLLDQIKEWAGVPVVLKGIMSPDEASEAVTNGADGIVVSNHGGRVIDGAPATIEILPKIANAVQGRVPLLVDAVSGEEPTSSKDSPSARRSLARAPHSVGTWPDTAPTGSEAARNVSIRAGARHGTFRQADLASIDSSL